MFLPTGEYLVNIPLIGEAGVRRDKASVQIAGGDIAPQGEFMNIAPDRKKAAAEVVKFDRVEVASGLLNGAIAEMNRLLAPSHGEWGGGAYIYSNSRGWEECRLHLAAITGAVTGIVQREYKGISPAIIEQISKFRTALGQACASAAQESNSPTYAGYPDVVARKQYRVCETENLRAAYRRSSELDEIALKLIDFSAEAAAAEQGGVLRVPRFS